MPVRIGLYFVYAIEGILTELTPNGVNLSGFRPMKSVRRFIYKNIHDTHLRVIYNLIPCIIARALPA